MLNQYNTQMTIELREIVENGVDIWDFEYPSFYKGEDKTAFERKVIDHYYFRQIGQETVGRFKHYFRTRIREIMPYYIQMYKSVELMESVENPFEAYNLTETYDRETTDSGSSSSESNGSVTEEKTDSKQTTRDNKVKRSDTPQGNVTNLTDGYMSQYDTENGTDSETVGSNGSGTSSSSSTAQSSGSATEKYTLTRKGNIGVQPLGYEVNALRSALINVDMMVIKELNDLFLCVY